MNVFYAVINGLTGKMEKTSPSHSDVLNAKG
jgi:hypothetical protein